MTAPADAMIWTVQAEGGEGGESGALATNTQDAAYLTDLGIVDAHLRAAVAVYAAGMVPEAIGLAGHPEAEVMGDLRPLLADRNVPDFTDALDALSAAIGAEAPLADVKTAYGVVAAQLAEAAKAEDGEPRARLDAIAALTRGAGAEYDQSVTDGAVSDPVTLQEAFGYIQTARQMASALATSPDPAVATAGAAALDSLNTTDPAFGDLTGTTLTVDPSLIYGAAAQIDFAAAGIN